MVADQPEITRELGRDLVLDSAGGDVGEVWVSRFSLATGV